MKNKKLLNLLLLPLLASSISGCDGNENDTYTFTQLLDEYNVLPKTVTDANTEIDILIYIEGQNGTIEDIGNYSPILNEDGDPVDPKTGEIRKYGPEDIQFSDLGKFVGAAQAFKNYAPGVKINVLYCSIDDYERTIYAYREQYGHLPHVMHPAHKIVDMLSYGYIADLNQYSDSAYFDSYNEYFMSRFNFGGFQAAVPLQVQPWGVYTNTMDLEEYNVIDKVVENGVNTEEYKDWVDNFTWESFMEAIKLSTTESHAGLSRISDFILSVSMPTIYNQYIREGSVDLTSNEVQETLAKLLGYESELATGGYTVYSYEPGSNIGITTNKNKFPNAAHWSGTRNFCEDQYSTFYTEAPWAIDTISQYIVEHNLQDDIKVDVLPYPIVDDNEAYSAAGVGGLVIGNQCPVGGDNGSRCEDGTAALEQEVAAYFAMFLGADPRAIDARSKIKYTFDDILYEGAISLPLIKKDFRFDWQDDPQLAKDDPSLDYDDNWQYQMALWFDTFEIYVTDNQPADVENFTNIPYGLTVMLDNIYGNKVTALNMATEPTSVYEDEVYVDIFELWDDRYVNFVNTDTLSGSLGTETYVSEVLANLATVEERINSNAEKVYADLNMKVAMYYGTDENGAPLYDMLDRTNRNNYEGSIN